MNIFNKLSILCLLSISLLLPACGGLTSSNKPALTRWWLDPSPVGKVAGLESKVPLRLSMKVVPGLDTDRILTLSEQAALKPYAAARWADNLPDLLESLVSRSLEASGRFELHPPGRRDAESCDLDLLVESFFALLGPSGQTDDVSITIRGRYQCESEDAMTFRLDASRPVSDGSMDIIVTAFQQAMDQVMLEMLAQLRSFTAED